MMDLGIGKPCWKCGLSTAAGAGAGAGAGAAAAWGCAAAGCGCGCGCGSSIDVSRDGRPVAHSTHGQGRRRVLRGGAGRTPGLRG